MDELSLKGQRNTCAPVEVLAQSKETDDVLNGENIDRTESDDLVVREVSSQPNI